MWERILRCWLATFLGTIFFAMVLWNLAGLDVDLFGEWFLIWITIPALGATVLAATIYRTEKDKEDEKSC